MYFILFYLMKNLLLFPILENLFFSFASWFCKAMISGKIWRKNNLLYKIKFLRNRIRFGLLISKKISLKHTIFYRIFVSNNNKITHFMCWNFQRINKKLSKTQFSIEFLSQTGKPITLVRFKHFTHILRTIHTYILGYFSVTLYSHYFCNFRKKGPRTKWTIYSTFQTILRDVCLSVILEFYLSFVAHIQPTPAYVEAWNIY